MCGNVARIMPRRAAMPHDGREQLRSLNADNYMQKLRQAVIKHLWWIVAIVGIALLICHSFQFASVTVDTTSLILVVIILLSPFIAAIKRIKIGEFEAEIDPAEVKKVTDEVASSLPKTPQDAPPPSEDPPAIQAIRELAKTDRVIALAKLRIEIETTLRKLLNRSGTRQDRKTFSLIQITRDLAAREVLSRDLSASISDVISLCNRAVHGEAIRDTDADTVITVGTDLLQSLDYVLREYGVGHPVEDIEISESEVEDFRSSKYRVTTIIPTTPVAHRKIYLLTHDELEDFFEGYSEFAEFVVGIERDDEVTLGVPTPK